MPRWYWWIAGGLVVRNVGESVSVALAAAVGGSLLVGYWGYRVASAANEAPGHRAHAAGRESRRIAAEVGDAALGWALLLLVIFGIVAIAATWPPDWKLALLVCGLVVLAVVALVVSLRGATGIVSRHRARKWEARREALAPALRAWGEHVFSVEPTDRAIVKRVVEAAYARNGRGGLTLRWASSPPEFVRLLEEVSALRPLPSRPPQAVFLLPSESGYWAWERIWASLDLDNSLRGEMRVGGMSLPMPNISSVGQEVAAALAAGIGVEGLDELVAHTSWFAFRDGAAIVLEHPTEFHLDADGELHNASGPAARFRDGWAVWALEGVVVPSEAIDHPERFDPRVALQDENLEVRRVLVEHLGWDRVVRASGLSPHAEDGHGRLWRLPVPADEPVLLLEVENATPDPDGRRRPYFLRVPPDMRSPREATAWTFGLSELEYAPDVES